MSTVTSKPATQVTAGPFRASYANVWTARKSEDGGDPKYSIVLLWPKTDKATTIKIQAGLAAAKTLGQSTKWGNKIPPNLKGGIQDGDSVDNRGETRSPEYAGHWFISASDKKQPGIVNPDMSPIIDQTQFYSGCHCYASVNFFPYSNKSVGIGCGLNNLMKFKDGEALGGRTSAASDFADITLPAATADDDFLSL